MNIDGMRLVVEITARFEWDNPPDNQTDENVRLAMDGLAQSTADVLQPSMDRMILDVMDMRTKASRRPPCPKCGGRTCHAADCPDHEIY